MGNKPGGSKVVGSVAGKVSLDTYILHREEEDRVRQLLAPVLTTLNLSLCGPLQVSVTPKGEMTISGVTVTAQPITAAY